MNGTRVDCPGVLALVTDSTGQRCASVDVFFLFLEPVGNLGSNSTASVPGIGSNRFLSLTEGEPL
jgi:hypothetical protein